MYVYGPRSRTQDIGWKTSLFPPIAITAISGICVPTENNIELSLVIYMLVSENRGMTFLRYQGMVHYHIFSPNRALLIIVTNSCVIYLEIKVPHDINGTNIMQSDRICAHLSNTSFRYVVSSFIITHNQDIVVWLHAYTCYNIKD